jgi:hypothetical protein
MASHRLSVALAGVALTLAGMLAARSGGDPATTKPGVLRATAIELVDEKGRVRGQLNVEASGEAVLRLRDASGEIRVKLGAGDDGSGLLLLDTSTEPGIQMLAKAGATSVTLTNRHGQRRVIEP